MNDRYIGVSGENMVERRHFKISRYHDGVDLYPCACIFCAEQGGKYNAVSLTPVLDGDNLIYTLDITRETSSMTGWINFNLTFTSADDVVLKTHTNQFFVYPDLDVTRKIEEQNATILEQLAAQLAELTEFAAPTKMSELENDSGYITEDDLPESRDFTENPINLSSEITGILSSEFIEFSESDMAEIADKVIAALPINESLSLRMGGG